MHRALALVAALAGSAALATPEADITSRHPDGLPAVITAFGHPVSFSDSRGESCAAPVILQKADNMAARIRTQYVWLEAVHPGFRRIEHATRHEPALTDPALSPDTVRVFSWFRLEGDARNTIEVCFDISEAARPAIRAKLERQREGATTPAVLFAKAPEDATVLVRPYEAADFDRLYTSGVSRFFNKIDKVIARPLAVQIIGVSDKEGNIELNNDAPSIRLPAGYFTIVGMCHNGVSGFRFAVWVEGKAGEEYAIECRQDGSTNRHKLPPAAAAAGSTGQSAPAAVAPAANSAATGSTH